MGRKNLNNEVVEVKYVKRMLKATVAFDDASPKALFNVQDGDIVHWILTEVTIIWDGDGTATLGDGADPDGFANNANLDKGVLGYKLNNADKRGAYLWDVVNGHEILKVYAGVDTIDAVIVQGTSTQGQMTAWAFISRLK